MSIVKYRESHYVTVLDMYEHPSWAWQMNVKAVDLWCILKNPFVHHIESFHIPFGDQV